jgi:hypothetical protein
MPCRSDVGKRLPWLSGTCYRCLLPFAVHSASFAARTAGASPLSCCSRASCLRGTHGAAETLLLGLPYPRLP